MFLVFLASTAIALICAYIFRHSSDGLTFVAASILIISFFLSLLVAPWPIEFLLLILVLLSNRRHFLASQSLAQPEQQEEKKIQLSYRGAKYETTAAPTNKSIGKITGKYRGHDWRVHA
jgi:membrane protein implicated in regulation of membrane protease activity